MNSWQATAPPRRSLVRSSRFRRFWERRAVPSPNGVEGAVIALVAIFLPGALLVYASLPFWNLFRQHSAFQRALSGINACVVGILLAALYLTIWTQTVQDALGFRGRIGGIRTADGLEAASLAGSDRRCHSRGGVGLAASQRMT